jgi:hypothetical protein
MRVFPYVWIAWPTRSQRISRLNARTAMRLMEQRRLEREDVERFLEERYGDDTPLARAAAGAAAGEALRVA